MSSSSPCHPELLQRSLTDQLSEQQEQQLMQHLCDCADCRQQLENLAGSRDDWAQIEQVLRTEEQQGTPPPVTAIIDPEELSSDRFVADFAVDFLEPSSQSDSLGRLGDIEIKGVIGQGGNGIVLKGFQSELNRLVAVKVMAPHLATSAAARQRFSREAQATAAIVHPSVMPVLLVNAEGRLPYLVMPYVDCESLQQRIDRLGALPLIDVLRIGVQVARGLAAAHAQGLVHRDVKPANILLEKGVDRVMLTDFGLARAIDDASLTRSGLIAGTPQYMSPEQARGDSVDPRSDLFSLGSVLYAMATGRPPFRAESSYGILRRVTDDQARSLCELNSDVPEWTNQLVQQLLSKAPAERAADAEAVAELLEDCVAHVQQPQAHPLPAQLTSRTHARRSRRAIVALLLMVVGLSGFIPRLNSIAPESTNPGSEQKTVSDPSVNTSHPSALTPPANMTEAGLDRQLDKLEQDIERLWQDAANRAATTDELNR